MVSSALVVIVICLLLSALFSALEISFISADKFRIELEKKQGSYAANLMSFYQKSPSRFIISMLVGNNVTLVIYGIFMALALQPWIDSVLVSMQLATGSVVELLLQTIVSTLVVLITAEFLPKSLALINPNGMLRTFALPVSIIYYLLWPAVALVNSTTRFIIRHVFKSEYSDTQPAFGLTDLNNYLKRHLNSGHSEDKIEVSTKIFNKALEFKNIRVRECMIPRTDIIAVDLEDGMPALKSAFYESGHTKIPVYRESIDEIIGFCHALSIYKKPKQITDIISPIVIVPETMPARELLVQFTAQRKSIALVVDEFGGTAGLVTIEDIVEQILGEIQDEHDDEDYVEEQLNEKEYLMSARHEIDYLNKSYKWNIEDGDYETLGGYILSVTENIPKEGDIIVTPGFQVEVISVTDARIDTVKITLTEDSGDNG
jgi:CBS domain containing-hemolysin-like protein